MTILVTGGNGQLGCSLRLASAESLHRYIFTDVEELDITSVEAIEAFFQSERPDVVVNCAAYTAVERAEEDESQADLINHKAVALLAAACQRHDAMLIHISTDYIFSGEGDTPYTEECAPAPINAYGRTKLSGERAVVESGCKSIILRTSWLYSEFGNNFVKTMLRLGAERNSLNVIFDQVGTPTYAADLAEAILTIIDQEEWDSGIYHFSNEGVCSWYDFCKVILQLSGNTTCQVSPIESSAYPVRTPRPHYSVLNKGKIKNTFNIEIPYWINALERCINILKQNT